MTSEDCQKSTAIKFGNIPKHFAHVVRRSSIHGERLIPRSASIPSASPSADVLAMLTPAAPSVVKWLNTSTERPCRYQTRLGSAQFARSCFMSVLSHGVCETNASVCKSHGASADERALENVTRRVFASTIASSVGQWYVRISKPYRTKPASAYAATRSVLRRTVSASGTSFSSKRMLYPSSRCNVTISRGFSSRNSRNVSSVVASETAPVAHDTWHNLSPFCEVRCTSSINDLMPCTRALRMHTRCCATTMPFWVVAYALCIVA